MNQPLRSTLEQLSLMGMHNPPHPGEFIRETYIYPFEISVRALSENFGSITFNIESVDQ